MHDTSPGGSLIDSLEPALARRDAEKVESLLAGRPSAESDKALRAIADSALQARRWLLAQVALQRLNVKDVACHLQFNLARNFAALQEHRPAAYEVLATAPADSRFQIAASATGLPTIFFTDRPGHATSFSANNDPLKAVGGLFGQLKAEIDHGAAFALCGLGDGYLLNALAQKPPSLYMTMQQTIHLIEPQTQVLILNMMVHDYSADAGPIKQPRFRWHVGREWRQQMEADCFGDLLTPLPALTINQGIDSATITAAIEEIQQIYTANDAVRKVEVETHYATVRQDEWVNRFSSFPNQPPRVMLYTTRFSTVLQYSTRDAAQAFGQLGWEAMVVIEPSDWQRCGPAHIRKAMAEFKPDLIFQIDHLRHEHGDLFPPQLPFACWIQDHLPNLCHPGAGEGVKLRDFVLSGMGSLFVQQHSYPRRQIVDLPQLARVPMRPTEWTSDGEDIIYVSNWSKTAEQIVPDILKRFSQPPELAALVAKCCTAVIDRYAAGQTVSTFYDVRLMLTECEKATGLTINKPALKDEVINVIFDRLNNTLYRHQALQWSAEVVRSMGLQLALYGNGWDTHPTLAAYARGPVKAGEELELLTRRSKISLQLEPYACFSHARLLSGLFAGGFFLVRDHPFNHLTQELLNFVDRQFDADACSVEQARAAVKESYREKLEEMLVRCACLGEQVDPIGMVRDWQRGGTLIAQGTSLPRLTDVLFDDRASLEVKVRRFINNAQLRYDVSTEQRQNTQSRLSYRAGLDRVVRAIGKLIAAETAVSKAQAA